MRYGVSLVEHTFRFIRPRSWLDFGAGGGELLLAATAAGVDEVVGVELDHYARAVAGRRNLEVAECLTEFAGRTFEVVSASHVLEHVEDPLETLRRLADKVSQTGAMVICQPTPRGIVPNLWPAQWPGWRLGEHLWHFTPRSMTRLVVEAGMAVENVHTTALDYSFQIGRSLPAALLAKASTTFGHGDQFYLIAKHP